MPRSSPPPDVLVTPTVGLFPEAWREARLSRRRHQERAVWRQHVVEALATPARELRKALAADGRVRLGRAHIRSEWTDLVAECPEAGDLMALAERMGHLAQQPNRPHAGYWAETSAATLALFLLLGGVPTAEIVDASGRQSYQWSDPVRCAQDAGRRLSAPKLAPAAYQRAAARLVACVVDKVASQPDGTGQRHGDMAWMMPLIFVAARRWTASDWPEMRLVDGVRLQKVLREADASHIPQAMDTLRAVEKAELERTAPETEAPPPMGRSARRM